MKKLATLLTLFVLPTLYARFGAWRPTEAETDATIGTTAGAQA